MREKSREHAAHGGREEMLMRTALKGIVGRRQDPEHGIQRSRKSGSEWGRVATRRRIRSPLPTTRINCSLKVT
jgi:hypothetical protein